MPSPLIAVGPRPLHQRRALRPWLLAAAFAVFQGLALAPAQAAAPPVMAPTLSQAVEAAPPGASVPVGVWTSHEGESEDAFMLRLAVPMHAFTDRTGFEACGVIQHEIGGSRMRVYVTTNHSQISCVRVMHDDPAFAPNARMETIHTHPGGHSITPNANDAALLPGYLPGQGRYDLHSNDFSARDFALGPGYVVIPGAEVFGHPRLLHQTDGHETERDLGRLPKLSLAEVLPDVQRSDNHQAVPSRAEDSRLAATVTKPSLTAALRNR